MKHATAFSASSLNSTFMLFAPPSNASAFVCTACLPRGAKSTFLICCCYCRFGASRAGGAHQTTAVLRFQRNPAAYASAQGQQLEHGKRQSLRKMLCNASLRSMAEARTDRASSVEAFAVLEHYLIFHSFDDSITPCKLLRIA